MESWADHSDDDEAWQPREDLVAGTPHDTSANDAEEHAANYASHQQERPGHHVERHSREHTHERSRDRPRREFPTQPSRPIPNSPPYTAFLGGLEFRTSREDILNFFSNSKIEHVRLPTAPDGKLKGFGYVTFANAESLSAALEANGKELRGRRVRVDVAEERPRHDDHGFKERSRNTERGDDDQRPPRREGGWGRGGWHQARDRDHVERQRPTQHERHKIQLQPRTLPRESDSTTERSSEQHSKPNPFGAARPRDEMVHVKRAEERLKQLELKAHSQSGVGRGRGAPFGRGQRPRGDEHRDRDPRSGRPQEPTQQERPVKPTSPTTTPGAQEHVASQSHPDAVKKAEPVRSSNPFDVLGDE